MSTPRFALIGHPVAHSLSPRIHAAFARQTGIAMDYGLIDATAEEFDDALAKFAAAGGKGANVTLPHKARAAAACESVSDRARRCGVVNTLTRTATGWAGDNTDGLGLVRDLTDRHGQDLRGRRVLLIGAGGVAHGVAPALLDAGISGLMIVNRTDSRTDALADLLGDPARVHPRNFADLHTQGVFDLIINATSIGHAADGGELPLPQSLIAPRGDVVDLGYGEASIGFLAWARAGGADQMMDGLGMLVEQAAESFKVWHGVRPNADEIYAELRAESGATTVA